MILTISLNKIYTCHGKFVSYMVMNHTILHVHV